MGDYKGRDWVIDRGTSPNGSPLFHSGELYHRAPSKDLFNTIPVTTPYAKRYKTKREAMEVAKDLPAPANVIRRWWRLR